MKELFCHRPALLELSLPSPPKPRRSKIPVIQNYYFLCILRYLKPFSKFVYLMNLLIRIKRDLSPKYLWQMEFKTSKCGTFFLSERDFIPVRKHPLINGIQEVGDTLHESDSDIKYQINQPIHVFVCLTPINRFYTTKVTFFIAKK